MMKNVFLILIAIGLFCTAIAQDNNLNNSTKPVRGDSVMSLIDGFYRNSTMNNRKVVEYAALRHSDVVYRKRIWREIDLREKMNAIFASPKSRLMDIIVSAIQSGELTAYDPTPTKDNPTGDNFEFMVQLPIEQVMARLGVDSVLVEEFNENNEVISSHYESRPFSGENVIKFRIKEDWIFDKQRSVFEPRIVGIAPLISPVIPGLEYNSAEIIITEKLANDPFDPFALRDENSPEQATIVMPSSILAKDLVFNTQVEPTPAFWIYFPEARHVFVNKEVVNRNNAATGLSYDDVFVKRIFTSYIVKQDNPHDLRIKDYIQEDIDRLYESERIKNVIMDWEQDLWSY